MQQIKRQVLAVICGILIGSAISACAGAVKPLVKWWFVDGKEEMALVRKTCDDKGENCKIDEKKTLAEADGYFAISAEHWRVRENYIKELERNCK